MFSTQLSTIKSKKSYLTKIFSFKDDKLVKTPSANLTHGIVTNHSIPFETLESFLSQLTPDTAVTWGICSQEGDIYSSNVAPKDGAIRNRKHFNYPDTAICMLDFDDCNLAFTDARNLLISICPQLADAPMLMRSSASSCIFYRDTPLTKQGIRALLPVRGDVAVFGNYLFKQFWLNGHGKIYVSKSGALLTRSPIDSQVWQPERLDFCAKPLLLSGLTQKTPTPQYFNAYNTPICASLFTLTPTQERKYEKMVLAEKEKYKDESEDNRNTWKQERIQDVVLALVKNKPDATQEEKDIVKKRYVAAIDTSTLTSDFILHKADGSIITVDELLRNKELYHATRFHDPIEFNYREDSRIAYFNGRAAHPYIFSHAHGGKRYKLIDRKLTIEIISGKRHEAILSCIAALRATNNFYERMGEIVEVTEKGDVIPQDLERIKNALDAFISFLKLAKDGYVRQDCPECYAKGVLASTDRGLFKDLEAVATQAVYDARVEEVICKEGYQNGILVRYDDEEYSVPDNPTDDEVKSALEIACQPISQFPFASDRDKSVMLSAMLTAVTRNTLPTAPGYLMTAPTIGSGKTLLTHIVAALASEKRPHIISELKGQNADEELSKCLTTALRRGSNSIIFDNTNGYFKSNTLCTYLTDTHFNGRILGQSNCIDVPTRGMLLVSGNNTTLQGDLCRRVITCTIDPKMEQPWMRKFNFDPVDYIKRNRRSIVSALLTLLQHGVKKGKDLSTRTASFELWSDTVRKTVHHLTGIDVVEAVNENVANDPETLKLSAFLEIMQVQQDVQGCTVAEIISKAECNSELKEIVTEICSFNRRILGSWLSKNAGREIDNLRIEKAGMKHKVMRWRVVKREDVQQEMNV